MGNRTSVPPGRKRAGAFSLVELAVTLAVLAIITAIAIPSFTAIINSNRLATASNELVATLQFARMEAVRRNSRVVVCSSANAEAATPACTTGTWGQWIVFADRNADDALSAGELLRTSVLGPTLVARAANPISNATQVRFQDRIVFNPDGFAYAQNGALLSGAVNVCIRTARPQQNRRNVSIAGGSRFRVDTPAGDAACPVP